MSLLGRLEDLSLPDIIQIVFLSRRTGILEIVDDTGRSTIMFHHGQVVDATSPADPDLESHLRGLGVIEESSAAELDRMVEEGAPLGTALLELGLVETERLSAIVGERITAIVAPLLSSREGEFNFILSDSMSQFDLQYDPDTLFREGGISPQQILGAAEGERLKPLRGLEETMKAGKALLGGPGRASSRGSIRTPSREIPLRPAPPRSAAEALDELLPPTPSPAPPAAAEDDPFEISATDEVAAPFAGGSFSFTPLEEEEAAAAKAEEVEEIGAELEVEDAGEPLEPAAPPAAAPQRGASDEGEAAGPFETSFTADQMPGVSDLPLPLDEELSPGPDEEDTPEESLPEEAGAGAPTDAFIAVTPPARRLDAEAVGETVVLYEPDPLLRVAARRAFTRKGFEFLQFGALEDAGEAVGGLLERGTFFVSFLDLGGTVAGSDSPELLLERVKQKDGSLPVLVIDREADLRRRHALLGMGADFYLTKPSAAHLQPGLAEETLGLFADELMMFAQRAFAARRERTGGEGSPELAREMASLAEKERTERSFALLRRLISELTDPDDLGQVCRTILRMVGESLDRGALFAVLKDRIEGLDGFAGTAAGDEMEARVRRITIPRSEASVFADVIGSKVLHRGKLKRTGANQALVRALGEPTPSQVVVLPIVNRNEVVGVLYGDNAVSKNPIRDMAGLEIFLGQAGLAFENAMIASSRRKSPRG
ncbi:MAG TPA: DUF4388 domain-containing protein [Thermoanaerobaculia bacterium]|nr:DUF4388 domain-containing protein [Thermoanaerobaculia bacterium]